MEIAFSEIFGPVAMLLSYQDIEEAIAITNDIEYGLTNYIQTAHTSNALSQAKALAKRLRSGTVQINYPTPEMEVPFGGFKQSGNGREYAK